MVIFKTAAALTSFIKKQREKGLSVGFVPTMGALHKGHISLVDRSSENNDITVVSIFINPTQFNNAEDFRHYPVTIEKDIEQLVACGTGILFLPPVVEIYPPGFEKKHYDLGQIEHVLEGEHRPGHFQGVCQVVDRLMEIASPQNMYIGQKDFQQCMVIKKLVGITGREQEIKLHIVPTLREPDGLAMSSRNLRLTKEQREKATVISQQLSWIKKEYGKQEDELLKKKAKSQLISNGFHVDYVEIADASTLSPAPRTGKVVALIAATIGDIRLIDNMLLN